MVGGVAYATTYDTGELWEALSEHRRTNSLSRAAVVDERICSLVMRQNSRSSFSALPTVPQAMLSGYRRRRPCTRLAISASTLRTLLVSIAGRRSRFTARALYSAMLSLDSSSVRNASSSLYSPPRA